MTLESILMTEGEFDYSSNVRNEKDDEQTLKETADFKMVTFSLSGKDYALDIMYVKEIAKAGQFTFVPNTMPFVVGVYNLRGEIIPILDLRIFFNISDKRPDEDAVQNLLILTVDDQTFGVIVDKIDKVVALRKSSIQPSHPLFADINIKYIAGVVENDRRLYVILDAERIFSKSKEEKKSVEKPVSVEKIEVNNAKNEAENVKSGTESVPLKNEVNKTVMEQSVSVEQNAVPPKDENVPKEEPSIVKNETDVNYNFLVESLARYAGFYVSDVNEEWVKTRYEKWIQEKGETAQIQGESDAIAFLMPFWSECTDSWWTKEYADNVFNLLPENSAKQITVWNPGCSKGMESYCLACVLSKKYPDSKIRIYAQDSDLLKVSNAPLLTVPADAKYEWLSEFFVQTASGENAFCQKIKDILMFEYHDCTHTNALPVADVIFARDLLSVLKNEVQKNVITDFSEKLKGNGLLILGENEVLKDSSEFIERTEGAVTAFSKQ